MVVALAQVVDDVVPVGIAEIVRNDGHAPWLSVYEDFVPSDRTCLDGELPGADAHGTERRERERNVAIGGRLDLHPIQRPDEELVKFIVRVDRFFQNRLLDFPKNEGESVGESEDVFGVCLKALNNAILAIFCQIFKL